MGNADESVRDAETVPLWIDQLPPRPRRSVLVGSSDVDVAIIGGGFSGLWTALYLTRLDPSIRVAVVEREHCGFGASGRNGGWAIGEMAGSFDRYAKRSNRGAALRQMRAMFSAVDEIGERIAELEIDCGWAKGGTIRLARTGPQAERQVAEIEHERARGFTEEEIRLLGPDEAREHLNATRVRSGIFFGPSAAVSPARLVTGLADACEQAGVKIYEGTAATNLAPGRVETAHGELRAEFVVRATEAYTSELPDHKRTFLPVYSLMIATEPLEPDLFDRIGLQQRQTFADDRFMVIYGQRTDDNRLAFGGRGVPYLFGSAIRRETELHLESHRMIRETLVDLLPQLSSTQVTHRWGGVLAIPRNWLPGLGLNRSTGLGWLGGYVGEGVAASNLAGRTMAELIVGQSTPRTDLPWVGVSAPRWEPEPFRFAGVRASRRLLLRADEHEEATDTRARLATTVAGLLRGD